ncbi:esterase/lipase family protein [Streptomyces sp. NBC_01506]|uniref:esterase/lipase family protein n=1 Tax=Streptomyces sp. NBC_01506 TaxID=2903887 RepID=UPI00386452CF
MKLRHAASALVGSVVIAVAAAAPSSSFPSLISPSSSSPASSSASSSFPSVTPGSARTTAAAPNTGLARFAAAFARSQAAPEMSPPGANDWSCRPSAAHSRPVVLIHGTWANAYANWAGLAPVLKRAGHCVYALNFGAPDGDVFKARGPVPESAKEVAAFVDKVLGATGAEQVDLVGHSQGGGLLPRWYLKFEGGAAKTHRLVGIAPSNHGTTASGMASLAKSLRVLDTTARMAGQAAKDQTVGSDVNVQLDTGGDTVPGVRYTTVVTRTDEVVTPYRQQYLAAGPDAPVDNLTLQDACPVDMSAHLGIAYSTVMYGLVLNALDPASARPAHCLS